MDKGGIYYGLNAVSKNMIVNNRSTSALPNGIILGVIRHITATIAVILFPQIHLLFHHIIPEKSHYSHRFIILY
ncbi:MAG: hypothetical protein R3Y67_09385, partial [Eubacteriales bacterium]